jgi:hypothetical protein
MLTLQKHLAKVRIKFQIDSQEIPNLREPTPVSLFISCKAESEQ